MMLDRAMQALPLPETLFSIILFLSHDLLRREISNMVISAAKSMQSG